MGESGKGKTTLLNILTGKINNFEGQLKWDEDSYNDINIDSIRNQMIYINQNPYIFNTTIRENLTLGENIVDERLNQIICEVGLSKWIENLPNGLNTIIDLNAKNISGGQKQRIALARGLLKNKSIILLDEPTSSLDEKSALGLEKLIFENRDLTVIMVTHNLRDEIKDIADYIVEL